MKRFFLLIITAVLITACKTDTIEPPSATLAPHFRMTATAQTTDAQGRSVECSLLLEFELRSETARGAQYVEYKGVHGGEITRKVFEKDGSGFGFFVDVYGEVVARVYSPNLIEITIPINATTDSRFYRSLSRFYGVADANGNGSGKWTCSPLDLDQGGYKDTLLTAEGEYQIIPQS